MRHDLTVYLRGAFRGTTLVYGVGIFLAFAVQVLLARMLGSSSYGDYYYVLAWVMALLVAAKAGLDGVIQRFMPAYLARREWERLAGLISWSSWRATIAACGIAAAVALIVSVSDGIPGDAKLTFYLGCAVLPVLAYVYLRSAMLKSLQHVVLALLPEAVIAPMVLSVAIGIFWLMSDSQVGAAHAMLATLAGLMVSAVLGRYLLLQRMPAELSQVSRAREPKVWGASARSMMLITGSHMLLNNADAIMLGLLADATSVGIYAVAAKVSVLVYFPLTIANAAVAPLIPRFHAQSDHAQLQQVLDQSMRLVTLLAVFLACVLCIGGHGLLSLFGRDFVAGYTALIILVVGGLINAVAGPSANLLSFTGSERFVSRVMIVTLGINIILNLLFIPRWGIEGAALATVISMMTWNLVTYVVSRRRLGVNPNGWLSSILGIR